MDSACSRVLCPFIQYHDGKIISCEGPVENTTVMWVFNDEAAAKEQKKIFCEKHYKRCELYTCIMQNRVFEDQS